MKIELKNFGPIDHFEFDMDKDLYVIYGENNLGKSYAMSAVYLILKKLSKVSLYYFFFDDFNINHQRSLLKELQSIDSRSTYLNIDGFLKDYLQHFLSNFLQQVQISFSNTFTKISNQKTDIQAQFCLKTKLIKITISIDQNNHFSLVDVVFEKSNIVNIKNDNATLKESKFAEQFIEDIKHIENDQINIIENIFKKKRMLYIKKQVKDKAHNLFLNIFGDVGISNEIFFLPASRSGLYQSLSSFGNIIAKLSQYRFQLNQSIEIPSLAEPVSDYFLYLSNAKSTNINPIFLKYALKIEKDILRADILVNDETTKIVYKSIDNNLKLDLSETSSMVSEIAPFVIYIKNIFGSTNQEALWELPKSHSGINIFIEEPEAHLHPKIQVEMMKVFVELVKAGVKVVMTTHSDYMKDTLSNLLLSGDIKPEKVASYRFVMGENGSYDAGDMKATDEGIEDHNFTSVAVELYEERVRLLEKRYEANDTQ